MEKLKEVKGITLMALVITIIVLLILAGVSIYGGRDSIKTAESNGKIAQLGMVQHAILERYVEYNTTSNENILVGTKIELSEVQSIANQMGITIKATGNYYRIGTEDLKDLGITEDEDTYIVNYETGEAINETQKKTSLGDVLYIN